MNRGTLTCADLPQEQGSERFAGILQHTGVSHPFLALSEIGFQNSHTPLLAECGPEAQKVEPVETCRLG